MAVLAIDAGTTGITCLVINHDREVIGRAYSEFTQFFPQPGWVEHDAQEIYATAVKVALSACKAAKIKPKKLSAVGITNQRETTVIWDKSTGEPIHNALVWQDRRTAEACRKMRRHGKAVRQKTGLVIDSYFCATKIAWILDNVKGARKRADAGELAFGTIDCWLAWKLTGEHVTDVTNASRTLLWDINTGAWDPELCKLFGVPEQILPRVVPSSARIGDCRELGGAPLASLVGDQQSALFGHGATTAGAAKNTYGTGCFLLQHTGSAPVISKHGLITTRAASVDASPQFALEGSVFVGGAAVQWLRDGLGTLEKSADVEASAESVEDSGGVVVVPAFAGLGAPHWDSEARGAILGLTRGSTKAHIARATLESIALQCDDLLTAMSKDSGLKITQLMVDGGAAANDLLMQMQADFSGCQIRRPQNVEATALGAAFLAGLAVGFWSSDDLSSADGAIEFSPQRAPEIKRIKARWKQAVKAVGKYKP